MDALKGPLQRIGVTEYDDLVIRKLGSKAVLDPLVNSYAIARNSDFFPVLDLGAVRTRFLKMDATEFLLMGYVPVPLLDTLENRPHREQPFTTGENHHLLTAGMMQEAEHILDYFKWVTYKETPPRGKVANQLVNLMRSFRSVHNQCDAVEINGAWMLELHEVAQKTLPFLTKSEMDIIWTDLKSSPCYNNFPNKAKDWIALYIAVGQWDADTVIELAQRLLEEDLKNDTPSNSFLIMSLMLAHVTNNDTSSASAVWSRYGNEKAVNYLPIRLLLTNIEQTEMKSTNSAQIRQHDTAMTLLGNDSLPPIARDPDGFSAR
jgi:alkylhydroperoxidase/carboxymuconolactone decarboxylase family protein YurZ